MINSLVKEENRLLIVRAGIQIFIINLFKKDFSSTFIHFNLDRIQPMDIKINKVKTASIDFASKIIPPININSIISNLSSFKNNPPSNITKGIEIF